MVKKLLKYDFSSFIKTILPMEIILLGIAVITRLVQFFDNNSLTYNIFNISSVVLLIIAMVVCIVMTVVVCVVRFYRNLYTAEGYLSLTLPVTHRQHIISKLITSVTATIASIISVCLAGLIATLGELSHEIIKAVIFLAKRYFKICKANGAIFIVEALIGFIIIIAAGYLLLYACITLGQTAKKNRVLAAFGVYFIYYIITQVIGTVFIVLYAMFHDYIPFEAITDWVRIHPFTFCHLCAAALIIFVSAFGLLYFAVTEQIMKKKLNLE